MPGACCFVVFWGQKRGPQNESVFWTTKLAHRSVTQCLCPDRGPKTRSKKWPSKRGRILASEWGPSAPGAPNTKNSMIPCCRKLSLGRRAHRHGHVCLPAWPAGGQFFCKNAKSGPENGPKNASIFWPRFGAHEKKTVLQQKVGPKLRPFSGPKNGPAKM